MVYYKCNPQINHKAWYLRIFEKLKFELKNDPLIDTILTCKFPSQIISFAKKINIQKEFFLFLIILCYII